MSAHCPELSQQLAFRLVSGEWEIQELQQEWDCKSAAGMQNTHPRDCILENIFMGTMHSWSKIQPTPGVQVTARGVTGCDSLWQRLGEPCQAHACVQHASATESYQSFVISHVCDIGILYTASLKFFVSICFQKALSVALSLSSAAMSDLWSFGLCLLDFHIWFKQCFVFSVISWKVSCEAGDMIRLCFAYIKICRVYAWHWICFPEDVICYHNLFLFLAGSLPSWIISPIL